MPTVYPKCTPSEMMGLLVLLKSHNGSEDVARLADDLDLEIDEIIPSTEFSESLQLIKIVDGRATFTETGKALLDSTIRERKAILRDQLKKTTLFRTLLKALESSPEHRLSEEELNALIELTPALADELVENIINWGRYTELFRYDSEAHAILPSRVRVSSRSPPPGGSPPVGPASGSVNKAPRSATPGAASPTSSPPSALPVASTA